MFRLLFLLRLLLFHELIITAVAAAGDPNECMEFIMNVGLDGTLSGLDGGRILRPGISIHGTVEQDKYQYYQFCVARHVHEHQVLLKLTCLSGDANLYVSTEETRPQIGTSNWIAQKVGSDQLRLFTYLPEFPRDSNAIAVYIGVFGRTSSEFNLTAEILDLEINSDIRSRKEYYTTERKSTQRLRRVRAIERNFYRPGEEL